MSESYQTMTDTKKADSMPTSYFLVSTGLALTSSAVTFCTMMPTGDQLPQNRPIERQDMAVPAIGSSLALGAVMGLALLLDKKSGAVHGLFSKIDEFVGNGFRRPEKKLQHQDNNGYNLG